MKAIGLKGRIVSHGTQSLAVDAQSFALICDLQWLSANFM